MMKNALVVCNGDAGFPVGAASGPRNLTDANGCVSGLGIGRDGSVGAFNDGVDGPQFGLKVAYARAAAKSALPRTQCFQSLLCAIKWVIEQLNGVIMMSN